LPSVTSKYINNFISFLTHITASHSDFQEFKWFWFKFDKCSNVRLKYLMELRYLY